MKYAVWGLVAFGALGCTNPGNTRVDPTHTTAAITPVADQELTPNGWLRGSIGASVTSPIVLRPEQMAFGPPPPQLPPGAQVATLEGDPKIEGHLFTLRVRMPDGYRIMPHWHFSDEHVTVVSGNFLIGHGDNFDDGSMTSVPNGGLVVLPARHHHYAMAKGATEIQIHAVGPWRLVYVNPADDPSRKVASSK